MATGKDLIKAAIEADGTKVQMLQSIGPLNLIKNCIVDEMRNIS